jgi:16S rRNA G527 N7-methylase RsmG
MKHRLSNKERLIEQKGAAVEILNERDLSNQPKLANHRKSELIDRNLKIKFVSIKDSEEIVDKHITIAANELIVIQSSGPIFVDGGAGDFIIKIDLDGGTRDRR